MIATKRIKSTILIMIKEEKRTFLMVNVDLAYYFLIAITKCENFVHLFL